MSSESNTGFIKGVIAALGAIAALVAIYEFVIKPSSLPSPTPVEPKTVVIVVTATPQPQVAIPQTATRVPPTAVQAASPVSTDASCVEFTVGPTPTSVITGSWVATRICSPARSACYYTVERSSGGAYSTYEHNGPDDRRWVNVFCTEVKARQFANVDAKAMLRWWPLTQEPFPGVQ